MRNCDLMYFDSEGFGTFNDEYVDRNPLKSEARSVSWEQKMALIHSDCFWGIEICPLCGYRLERVWAEADEFSDVYRRNPGLVADEEFAQLWICWRCHFWQFYYYVYPGGWANEHYSAAISKMQEFDLEIPEGSLSEISQFILRRPNALNTINPKKLELLVRDVFQNLFSECEVTHIGGPDDGGVDLVLVDCREKKWLIQIKRRSSIKKAEPVETIRSLVGAVALGGNRYGIAVSTADHFSHRALEAIGRANEVGFRIAQIDRGKLEQMLGSCLPVEPWSCLFDSDYRNQLSVLSEVLGRGEEVPGIRAPFSIPSNLNEFFQ